MTKKRNKIYINTVINIFLEKIKKNKIIIKGLIQFNLN